MADTEPQWEWYRTFLCVLDTGSLSAAGRALGVAQPTVGRHIDSLEAALAIKLFIRSYDGFAPTDAALELRPYAAGVAATIAALRRVASSQGDGVRGTVRLTASEVVGVEVLPPILTKLRRAHPELVIELILSNKADDLLHREADIAVRNFRPTQDALVARRTGHIEIGLFAHRRYLSANGTPTVVDELAGHTLIGYDQHNAYVHMMQERWPGFSRGLLGLRADSDLAQMAMMRAGYGLGFCQARIAARDKALVRVLPAAFTLNMDTWVAMHEDLRESPRCAATFAALVEGMAAYVDG